MRRRPSRRRALRERPEAAGGGWVAAPGPPNRSGRCAAIRAEGRLAVPAADDSARGAAGRTARAGDPASPAHGGEPSSRRPHDTGRARGAPRGVPPKPREGAPRLPSFVRTRCGGSLRPDPWATAPKRQEPATGSVSGRRTLVRPPRRRGLPPPCRLSAVARAPVDRGLRGNGVCPTASHTGQNHFGRSWSALTSGGLSRSPADRNRLTSTTLLHVHLAHARGRRRPPPSPSPTRRAGDGSPPARRSA